jgi:hypothetical protein
VNTTAAQRIDEQVDAEDRHRRSAERHHVQPQEARLRVVHHVAELAVADSGLGVGLQAREAGTACVGEAIRIRVFVGVLRAVAVAVEREAVAGAGRDGREREHRVARERLALQLRLRVRALSGAIDDELAGHGVVEQAREAPVEQTLRGEVEVTRRPHEWSRA